MHGPAPSPERQALRIGRPRFHFLLWSHSLLGVVPPLTLRRVGLPSTSEDPLLAGWIIKTEIGDKKNAHRWLIAFDSSFCLSAGLKPGIQSPNRAIEELARKVAMPSFSCVCEFTLLAKDLRK